MVKRLHSRLHGRSLPQLLLIAGALAVTVVILAFLLYRERELLLQLQWRFNPWLMTSAFLAYIGALLMVVLVWADLMRSFGSTLPTTTHIEYFCLSQLAKRLPGTVWYLAGRSYLYKQNGESLRRVTFASSVELLLTFLSGALTTLLFLGYAVTQLTALPWWGWLLLAGLGLLLLHPRSLHYWSQRFNLSNLPTLHFGRLLLWIALYSLSWIIGGFILFATCHFVTSISFAQLPYLIGSWSLIGTSTILVFFLPSNLGFSEVGLSLLLATIVPSSLAVIIAVLNRIIVLIYEIVGIPGVLLLIRMTRSS